jgi:SAM-dependent methyltransferase
MLYNDNFKKIFKFNQYQRDRWIEDQARNIIPGSSVLDVGAGTCPYRNIFSHCTYKTHDFSALSKDQLTGQKGYGQIDYVSDILNIPVADESFDVVVCTEVLEHVPEPIRAVNEFCRMLKPNGILLLTAPLGCGLHQEPYHYYGGYTPYWYDHFLSQTGFHDIEIVPNGGFFKLFGQEGIRFAKMTAPWQIGLPMPWKIVWAMVWLMLLPLLVFFLPIICYLIDPIFDKHPLFTVGYHVSARKTGSSCR